MKNNIVNYLLVLVCLVGLTANSEELTQTNSNDSVRVNVTVGASALTTWENATETDAFVYGGNLGLSFENVLVKNLEVGARQSLSSYDRYSSYDTTTTTTTTGPDTCVTTTTTTPNPRTPRGHAWGWYKNHSPFVTTTTTEVIPGETIVTTTTETTTTKSSAWMGSTELYADYNLSLGKTVTLFAGANASVYYGEGLSPNWYVGPEAGVKAFVVEDVYLFGRVNYDFQVSDRQNNDGDQMRYTVGVGVRF